MRRADTSVAQAKRRRIELFPLGVFVAVGAILAAVVAAPRIWPQGEAPVRPHMVADGLLGNWLWWDGAWYLRIALHGYSYRPHHQSSVAFFPVYPLTVRLAGWLLPGGCQLAAIVVTAVSGAATLVLFHRWCRRRMSKRAARTAVVVLAVYPYAWFLYGAAYSDALFLAMTLAAFLLLESDHPLAAGFAGAVATASRPTGIAVVIGLAAVAIQHRKRSGAYVLLAASGLAAWCTYLAIKFGHPFAFIETEGAPGWNQPPGLHTWLKARFFHYILHDPFTAWIRLVPQAVLSVVFLAAVPAVKRRFGAGYAVFVFAAVVIPSTSSGDFMGVGRYLLLAFPVFAVAGSALAERTWARNAVIPTSCALLLFGTSLFAAGYLLT